VSHLHLPTNTIQYKYHRVTLSSSSRLALPYFLINWTPSGRKEGLRKLLDSQDSAKDKQTHPVTGLEGKRRVGFWTKQKSQKEVSNRQLSFCQSLTASDCRLLSEVQIVDNGLL